ncbi:MAG: glycosyltransferase family 4 protein [Endomicrobiales bacterium]|nr:glycosyltransferase family 4 protein [Endomicrobiales bacterium]
MRPNQNKRKVLVLGYLPPPYEGTAKLTELVVNSGLLKDEFDVSFLPYFKRKKTEGRGKLGPVGVVNNVFNIASLLWRLLTVHPDAVYMPVAQNRYGFFRDSIVILIGKMFGAKICAHFHGGDFRSFYDSLGGIYKLYVRRVLALVDRLILLGNRIVERFRGLVKDEQIRVLYNCVPYQVERAKAGRIHGKRFNVLFMGYLSKAKGALDLVKAAEIVLKEHNKDILFVMCGEPVEIERNIVFIEDPHRGYSRMMEIIEKNGISGYFKMPGPVSGEAKKEYFTNADLFVYPSYAEGCPVAVLEAMAYGLPVITTPVGALGEMLKEGQNCFFVEPGDYEGLSRLIMNCRSDRVRLEDMGRRNMELVRDRYNSQEFLRGLKNIFNEILSTDGV